MPAIVDAWGKRILTDSDQNPYRIHPWRRLEATDKSLSPKGPSLLTPELCRPTCCYRTRIPVDLLSESVLAGDSIERLASNYDLPVPTIKNALSTLTRPFTKWREPCVWFLDECLDQPEVYEVLLDAGMLVERFRDHFHDDKGGKLHNVSDETVIPFL